MNLHRTLLAAPVALALVHAAVGAPRDVRPNHWAYSSIQRLAQENLLGDWAGTFDGAKLVSRSEAATVIARLLDTASRGGGTFSAGDVAELNRLSEEFRDDLAAIGARVTSIEDQEIAVRDALEAMKRGKFTGKREVEKGMKFTGYIAVSAVDSDQGTAATAPVGGFTPVRTRYTGTNGDRSFFTLPQSSMAMDAGLGDGWAAHLQMDYSTDGANTVGGGVGLNEAYLTKGGFGKGGVELKLGGFALPFQSWEINGPFRTPKKTITPSAVNTFFEAFRPLGAELNGEIASETPLKWRLGVVSGMDRPTGTSFTVGNMNDNVGLGALGASNTLDGVWGLYAELEGEFGNGKGGYRVGGFNNGGDHGVGRLATKTAELNGMMAGLWFKDSFATTTFQYLRMSSDPGTVPTANNDLQAWYLMMDVPLNDELSLVVRYDDWENKLNTVAVTGTNGDAFTLALRRELSPTSDLKFEALFADERGRGNVATAAGDVEDDLIQLRYSVWF